MTLTKEWFEQNSVYVEPDITILTSRSEKNIQEFQNTVKKFVRRGYRIYTTYWSELDWHVVWLVK